MSAAFRPRQGEVFKTLRFLSGFYVLGKGTMDAIFQLRSDFQLDTGVRLPSHAFACVACSIFFFRSSIPERCLGEMLCAIEKKPSGSTEMSFQAAASRRADRHLAVRKQARGSEWSSCY
jgi:hypothetical protein